MLKEARTFFVPGIFSYSVCILQAMVETGERICEVQCNAPTFTVAWHPSKPLLAFACDDKVQYVRM